MPEPHRNPENRDWTVAAIADASSACSDSGGHQVGQSEIRSLAALALAVAMAGGACGGGAAGSGASATSPVPTIGRATGAPVAPTTVPAAASSPESTRPDDAFPGTLILGSPTADSVIVSVAAPSSLEVYVEHGPASGGYTTRTSPALLEGGIPVEIALTGLGSDAAWFYRVRYRPAGSGDYLAAPEASFHTQRGAGSAFTFAVEADPHIGLDQKASPELFRRELSNVRSARPDFLVDLGDTFMSDKLGRDGTRVEGVYAGLRDYFGITGTSVPLFLVNGNHDGESGWSQAQGARGVAARAANARRTYYPNPVPEGFYAGGASTAAAGLRDSSYAWEWGDALFVVLDPYSGTARKPGANDDLWDWTLGEAQYRWLAEVLRSSTSLYKFVFSHHIIGDVRGGIEWAGLYEWGGRGVDGVDAFDEQRPGWGLPIHDLFVKYGVTVFFQGHDHLYVRQELDGVVYQEVPQPATQGGDPQRMAGEYRYLSGLILGSPGHLEVTVADAGVTVDYVHTGGGAGDRSGYANGDVVHRYTIPRRAAVVPAPASPAASTLDFARRPGWR
jgi:hypothetical protein